MVWRNQRMIFVVMGKSATGKDTIFKRLLNSPELSLKKIVPYTTRPKRRKETDGTEYHFVSEERMNELIEAGKVAEHRSYNTIHGVWHYFTVDDNEDVRRPDSKYIMIATLEAYSKLRDYYGKEYVIPVYIHSDDYTRLKRSVEREHKQPSPNYEEVCRRYLADELHSSTRQIKEFAERAAINAPLQGTAADLVKIAMIDLFKKLNDNKLKSKIILQVHDELVLEVPKEELDLVKKLVTEAMELGQPLAVPLKIDVNVAESWKE